MPDTRSALDAALAAHSAAIRERDGLDASPVLAWVAIPSPKAVGSRAPPIAVTDSQGDEEAEFAVLTPDGQRGFVTRGILLDALDAVRIQPGE